MDSVTQARVARHVRRKILDERRMNRLSTNSTIGPTMHSSIGRIRHHPYQQGRPTALTVNTPSSLAMSVSNPSTNSSTVRRRRGRPSSQVVPDLPNGQSSGTQRLIGRPALRNIPAASFVGMNSVLSQSSTVAKFPLFSSNNIDGETQFAPQMPMSNIQSLPIRPVCTPFFNLSSMSATPMSIEGVNSQTIPSNDMQSNVYHHGGRNDVVTQRTGMCVSQEKNDRNVLISRHRMPVLSSSTVRSVVTSRTSVAHDGSYRTITQGRSLSHGANKDTHRSTQASINCMHDVRSIECGSGSRPLCLDEAQKYDMDIDKDITQNQFIEECEIYEDVDCHEDDLEEDIDMPTNICERPVHVRRSRPKKVSRRGKFDSVEYWNCGEASYTCEFCGALLWYGERTVKSKRPRNPEFAICCGKGKVQLPKLRDPPPLLQQLLDYLGGPKSLSFREKIRVINALFAFTSMGAHFHEYLNTGGAPYCFRISGQTHHRIGTLLPVEDKRHQFAQLYIYDGADEAEARLQALAKDGKKPNVCSKLVKELIEMLNANNPFAKAFRMARERFCDETMRPVRLRLIGDRMYDAREYNLPSANEVAAIIPGDGESTTNRDIIVEEKDGCLKRITELHPSFMALQYPLLFPYGEDGFRLNTRLNVPARAKGRKYMTMREYYAYRHHQRDGHFNIIQKGGRLFQVYSVDSYASIEENNLRFIKNNQTILRCDVYNGLVDRLASGDADETAVGKRYILPPSFVGSPRYMIQNYQDAMAICRWAGPPDLFITMTCNPAWPEIQQFTDKIRGQKAVERHDIACRIFKQKLDNLMSDLKETNYFGRHKASIYTIEFQKRGLPHAHILLFLHPDDKLKTVEDIDDVISAELPDPVLDPIGYDVVKRHMIHGPCCHINKSAPCMKGGKCEKGYYKDFCDQTAISSDGWPVYRRRNNGRTATVRRKKYVVDNRWVVPHNLDLLKKYDCHINVEWCNQGMLVKYLFKYLNKGHDRASIVIGEDAGVPSDVRDIVRCEDEIKQFQDCRYISASEALWRIFAFPTQYRSIGVERLNFHLENQNPVFFSDGNTVQEVVERTTAAMSQFTQWFEANKKYPLAKTLTYVEFPTFFTWHGEKSKMYWKPRNNKQTVIGRIYYAPPSSGELFYLRMLLNYVKGPESFQDLRTVDGVLYSTYREACAALRLLGDDTEWHAALQQYAQWQTGYQLREVFCQILCFSQPCDPNRLFMDNLSLLSEDIVYMQRRRLDNDDIVFSEEEILNYTLIEIERILNGNNRSLSEFPMLPQPDVAAAERLNNNLILAETRYDRAHEMEEFVALHDGLNVQQRTVYNLIIGRVEAKMSGLFFVYGNGGTGKTYLYKTLISSLRARGKIVLAVASSGIASLLLPGGRTAHSLFSIPIKIGGSSTCRITRGTPLGNLIAAADLIIWDEAPMQHKHVFEALNRTLKDVMQKEHGPLEETVFGGKIVVLGGDFRQVLPVIIDGSHADVVTASISRSDLWKVCTVCQLTVNMRLRDLSLDLVGLEKLREFSKWLLDLGDGKLSMIALDGEDEPTWVTIPDDMLIPVTDQPVRSIVESIYPNLMENIGNFEYFRDRAILAATNEIVDEINDHLIDLMPGEKYTILSADRICPTTSNLEEQQIMYPPEFLNTLRFSGIPNHKIELKVGTPVMLLRNINMKRGLCNGTRLIVSKVTPYMLECIIITGTHIGETVGIGRCELNPSESKWPFQFMRRQYPIKVCYAMTINKSQGQTFKNVGVYLPRPVFAHGQLYVAASRVTSREGLKFYIDNGEKCPNNLTQNIVYREVYDNIVNDMD